MTDATQNRAPHSTNDRRVIRWILVLQIIILGWLAKNHFDGAFNRSSHNQPTADLTSAESPPSLEPAAENAPSSFPTPARQSWFQPVPPLPSRLLRHPAPGRLQADMQRMLAEAHQAFADFDSVFSQDAAWAALPPSPAMNMAETPTDYVITLAVADDDPNAFDVRLDGRLLSVSSHHSTRTPQASSSQHYSSRLLLPGPVAPDTPLHITNETGRLRIRIPKPVAAPATATASR
jgi:HSP20 family molecular chaperone IbpA